MRSNGVDISVWNGAVDWQKLALNADFVFIKASQQVPDKLFTQNWQRAKDIGILRGAYHYFDWRVRPLAQAQTFIELIKNDPGELPPVVDYEMRPGAPAKLQAQGLLWQFVSAVKKAIGRNPIIYTGYYYWNEFGSPNVGWAAYPLWLAWYAPEWYVRTPRPWGRWTFWQHSAKGDGAQYGVQSASIDLNWFNGTVEELRQFATMG